VLWPLLETVSDLPCPPQIPTKGATATLGTEVVVDDILVDLLSADELVETACPARVVVEDESDA
jgi:hypothetical protein